MITNNYLLCHLCKSNNVTLFPTFAQLTRATSDCKPWAGMGKLCMCNDCHTVQKVTDAAWRAEAATIYSNYELYHQSPNGKEQPVFNSITGVPTPRSVAVLDYAQTIIKLKENCHIIDIGCGVGNTLKSLSRACATAQLYGFEPNAHKKDELEKLENVQKIYTDIARFDEQKFDVMTMIHVLEHIESPLEFLEKLKAHINHDGYLIIAVPDYTTNPFDLIIVDHASHFSLNTLQHLLERSGFELVSISNTTVNKEIVAVCRVSNTHKDEMAVINISNGVDDNFVQKQLDWLAEITSAAEKIAKSCRPFGIFGTSIAANWIYGALPDYIDFFVDEDLDRVGTMYHKKPVYAVNKIPKSSHVFVCLQPSIVQNVVERISSPQYALYATPAF